ncbi:MAG: uroporphyrinogen-III synthase [Nonlabens sp.]
MAPIASQKLLHLYLYFMEQSLLSTKTLTDSQQELVLNAGVGLVQYNVMKIQPLILDPATPVTQHIIVTSSNAIPALEQLAGVHSKIYCVGSETCKKISDAGFQVNLQGSNAASLAHKIVEHHSHVAFTFLCSAQRRDDLPRILAHYNIEVNECFVYESSPVTRSFDRIFAAVLFYSPLGVHAFAKAEKSRSQRAVCIGETTATAARLYYDEVIVANKAAVENTIVTAIKSLNNDKE